MHRQLVSRSSDTHPCPEGSGEGPTVLVKPVGRYEVLDSALVGGVRYNLLHVVFKEVRPCTYEGG